MLMAGSNGRVAWGYTNSYGDFSDVVIVEPDPQNPARYLSDAGHATTADGQFGPGRTGDFQALVPAGQHVEHLFLQLQVLLHHLTVSSVWRAPVKMAGWPTKSPSATERPRAGG